MQAVILAAGKGTRMGIKDAPKCLLKIGNKSIIEHQVNYLRNIGCKKILVVTGYNSNKIKNTLGNSVEYIFNKNFENSNNMYSLWKARDFIDDEFICIYGDLFFHNKILEKCVASDGDMVLVVERNLRDETMRVKIENKKIVQVNKKIDSKNTDGNFIGMVKFRKAIHKSLFDEMSELIEQQNLNAYFVVAIEKMIKKGIYAEFVETENLPWIDIDKKDEFESAKKTFSTLVN